MAEQSAEAFTGRCKASVFLRRGLAKHLRISLLVYTLQFLHYCCVGFGICGAALIIISHTSHQEYGILHSFLHTLSCHWTRANAADLSTLSPSPITGIYYYWIRDQKMAGNQSMQPSQATTDVSFFVERPGDVRVALNS